MKKLLFSLLFMLLLKCSYSQNNNLEVRNVSDLKGALIKTEQVASRDAKTGNTALLTITYVIDTLQRQLIHVSILNKRKEGEFTFLLNYKGNRLSQATTGNIEGGVNHIIYNYTYDESDYRLGEEELTALSETDEKYGLLKESKMYLSVLHKL